MIKKNASQHHLREALIERGVRLNQGYSGDLKAAFLAHSVLLDEAYVTLYGAFNGFPKGILDGGSGIRIWPIEEVLSPLNVAAGHGSRLAFADLLMGSNEISCDFSSSSDPIIYTNGEGVLAGSFSEFCALLANGDYDFL